MSGDWSVEDSVSLYHLKSWGQKYFGANAEGHLTLQPRRTAAGAIDLKSVVDDAVRRGVKLPLLLRFRNVLRHRVELLNETFAKIMAEQGYAGRYVGVYPVKVNPLRQVVEDVLEAGAPYGMGLEAGSKGELMAVLALGKPGSLLVVNGYKDLEVMRLAFLGSRLGRRVTVVIEKPQELDLLLAAGASTGSAQEAPSIGLRARLQTQGSGKWKYSTGHSSKFGLSTPEILSAVARLKAAKALSRVSLLHFHIGSQVTDIQAIKDAVKEAARLYAKLRKMGLPLTHLDCGGGLGVDYDGSRGTSDGSTNYNLKEYVSGIVSTVLEVCREEKVPEPNIVTESGRALTAHHSAVVVNAFGSMRAEAAPAQTEKPSEAPVVKALRQVRKSISPKKLASAYHNALQRHEEAANLFKLGYLSLEDKAEAESLFWEIAREIVRLIPETQDAAEEVQAMAETLREQYLCNFSLFQSLPDSWAIGQVFPIAPLHRLGEKPLGGATLLDITCDSDGKIARFSCSRKGETNGSLPLHAIKEGEPYYLGIFLVGAYQSIMGDIHNLFGRVNEVHVNSDPKSPEGYYLDRVMPGQTVKDLLAQVHYSDYDLVSKVSDAINARVRAGTLPAREGAELLTQYESVLGEYPYMEPTPPTPEARAAAAPPSAESPLALAAKPAAEAHDRLKQAA